MGFLLQEKARLFLAPFNTNQIFFSFAKPVSGRLGPGSENQSSSSEYLCIAARISFVCLPLPGCLPRLQTVDFSQTLLSSQRKQNRAPGRGASAGKKERITRKHPTVWTWLHTVRFSHTAPPLISGSGPPATWESHSWRSMARTDPRATFSPMSPPPLLWVRMFAGVPCSIGTRSSEPRLDNQTAGGLEPRPSRKLSLRKPQFS